MNETLFKRIGKECWKQIDRLFPEDLFASSGYALGKRTGYWKGFYRGAEYAPHQWISVDEALPEYDKAVIVRTWNGLIFSCHRSNRIGVETDDDKWCNYTGNKIVAWMPIPKFEPKEKEEKP